MKGKPNGFFRASDGLKQGDLLSAFLVILVSEAFSHGLNGLLSARKISSFALPSGCISISHLSFTADVI